MDADILDAGASSLRFMTTAFEDPSACVLLHCASGVSRSVTMAIHYLMRTESMAFQAALDRIRAVHPAAAPNSGFLRQLQALEVRLLGRVSFEQRTESCVASLARTASTVAFARMQSWHRVPSVESVGWMSSSSYQPPPKGGWLTRIPSVVTAPPSPKATVAEALMASPTRVRINECVAAEMEEETTKEDDSTKDHDRDGKNSASTSMAVSEGSDTSDPEDTRTIYAACITTPPRMPSERSVSTVTSRTALDGCGEPGGGGKFERRNPVFLASVNADESVGWGCREGWNEGGGERVAGWGLKEVGGWRGFREWGWVGGRGGVINQRQMG